MKKSKFILLIQTFLIIISTILLVCCTVRSQTQDSKDQIEIGTKVDNRRSIMTADIYFAGGCFWGTEHLFKQIQGVVDSEVGYANGNTKNPTYQQVCSGTTGFAETVKVSYDPSDVTLRLLMQFYLDSVDPFSVNKQGNDVGSQYRTGIYYTDENMLDTINAEISKIEVAHGKKVAIEIMPIQNFYPAEKYHQDYLQNNPGGYCHIDTALFQKAKNATEKPYTKKNQDELKKILSETSYIVTQEQGTEPPFQNEYWDNFEEGIYVDITTGEPLFISTDKFDSGCGWPAFSKPINSNLIEKTDTSHGMVRTEVRSKIGDAHLGHVFNDGPQELGGLRYCINSASLEFIPKSEMENRGYGHLLNNL